MLNNQSATISLPPSAQQFLEQLLTQRRLSPLTQRRYTQTLTVLHVQKGQMMSLSSITPRMMQALVGAQHAAGLSPRSLAVMVSSWRSYCAWALRQGLIAQDPSVDILTPKMSRPLPKALSPDVVHVLFKSPKATSSTPSTTTTMHTITVAGLAHSAVPVADADATSIADPCAAALVCRDTAVMELLYGCGLRASELLDLDWVKTPTSRAWIGVQAQSLRVLGKGNKPRSVPLPNLAQAALAQYQMRRDALINPKQSCEAMFLGVRGGRLSGTELRRITQKIAKEKQLGQGVHPHMLRHSYASHLLQSSGDLRGVQELLGHASIQATQVYTRLDFQHLAKVYDAAHPRAKLSNKLPA